MGVVMNTRSKGTVVSKFLAVTAAMSMSSAFAADLPTAPQIFEKMGLGINIGNTMEVPGNPTLWGNKFPTEDYIKGVKAAGFNTIRIPCAWDSHATNSVINESWMDSVQTVVDYCVKAGLYTILNIHWDGGWLEENLKDDKKIEVNAKQKAYWTQIAKRFKDYDEKLLFASANEPATTDENYKNESKILQGYHQTFVDAVRATGGNNASRTLIIQGPSTSIDRSVEAYPASMMPNDAIAGRMMFEVHYYDPSPYTIVGEPVNWGAIVEPQYYWGEENYATGADIVHNCGYNPWGNAMGTPCSANDMQVAFKKMKTNYVDKGIPVIIGEFGANDRLGILKGDDYKRHRNGRIGWYKAVAQAAFDNKVVPIAWDTGHEGENHMTIIRRQSAPDGSVFDPEVMNAMRNVYGMPNLDGSSNPTVNTDTDKSIKAEFTIADSSYGQIEFSNVPKDWSKIKSVSIRAFFDGTISKVGDDYGFIAPNLVTMDGTDWNWQEAGLGEVELGAWNTYEVKVATTGESGDNLMVPGNPTNIVFMGLQMYTLGYTGNVYVDWIIFKNTDGTADTLDFNLVGAKNVGGGITAKSLIPTESIKATTTAIKAIATKQVQHRLFRQGDMLIAKGGNAGIKLFDLNGNLIRETRNAKATGAQISLSLQGLHTGLYIAKSGYQSLKINIK